MRSDACTIARSGGLELAGEPEDEAWSRPKQYARLSLQYVKCAESPPRSSNVLLRGPNVAILAPP